MKYNQTYRQITAILLALLVLQVVALKELHHLFEHHHEQLEHCHDTKTNESHLHGEEYAPIDCSICFFSFAPATLDFQDILVQTPVFSSHQNCFFYQKNLTAPVNWHFQLRGPPSLFA